MDPLAEDNHSSMRKSSATLQKVIFMIYGLDIASRKLASYLFHNR